MNVTRIEDIKKPFPRARQKGCMADVNYVRRTEDGVLGSCSGGVEDQIELGANPVNGFELAFSLCVQHARAHAQSRKQHTAKERQASRTYVRQ